MASSEPSPRKEDAGGTQLQVSFPGGSPGLSPPTPHIGRTAMVHAQFHLLQNPLEIAAQF